MLSHTFYDAMLFLFSVSYYTSVFSAMQFFGIFTAPMSGRLMDRKPGKKYQYNNPKFGKMIQHEGYLKDKDNTKKDPNNPKYG